MIEIKTQQDIMSLMQNPEISFIYSSFIADYFQHLMRTFSDEKTTDDFSLHETGHIVILEAKDDIRTCLGDINISDIFIAPIEYCNLINLSSETAKSLSFYQVFLLFNNEYCITLFADSDILSPEVKAFFNTFIDF